MPAASSDALHIQLLGGFRVRAGHRCVDEGAWRLRKARDLVKLLALTPGHGLHREQAIEALWPDRDAGAVAVNLRQALFVARRALDSCGADGAARLQLKRERLSLDGDGLEVDVEAFEAAAAAAQASDSIELHQAAIAFYAGELLPEDRFDGWTAARREALRERQLALLVSLAGLHQQAGAADAAIGALQRALVDDPLHEPANRDLMRIYALTGRRQRALGQFHLLRELLRRDFEDEPDEETRRLYRDILTRRIGGEDAATPSPSARRAATAPRGGGNLPLQLTSFVGRERELAEVAGVLRRNRLLTLTGAGGCGKTRLALEAAAGVRRDLRDGVWFVELADLSDEALVAQATCAVFGVENRSARPAEEGLAAHIADRETLLILDTCEHLISACATFAERLLTACPNLKLLATSREPLQIAGEINWRVPSLSLPDPDTDRAVPELLRSEAVRLFVDRAANVSSRFAFAPDNAAAVAEVCRRVDGIPLAIELAAARVGVLTPAQIAERLRDSLTVLSAGRRTALTRQQTLTATIDWSHALLDEREQTLFRRLGVFAAGCDLDALQAVCDGDLDVLGRLVDKSLVVVDEQFGSARYRLLDTVRHYARERLAAADETQMLERRHRAHYLLLAETLEPESDGREAGAARRRFGLEADEFRAALRTALDADPGVAMRLGAALCRFWHDRGERSEGARWLQAALRVAPDSPLLRARVLHGLSILLLRMSDRPRSLAGALEAVECFRAAGDQRAVSEELHHVGTLAWVFSDYDAAERWCEESRAIAMQAPDPTIVASVLHTLGVIAISRSETAAGRKLIARSVELLRELPEHGERLLLPVSHGFGRAPAPAGGAPRLFLEQTFVTARRVRPGGAVAYALADLAAAARDEDDVATARAMLDESLAIFRRFGDDLGAAQSLAQLGNLLSAAGEHEPARELHEESLALREAANDARGTGLSLLAVALAAAHAGDGARAGLALQRALALFERTDDGPGRGAAMIQAGYLAADEGRLEEARALQERALEFWTRIYHSGRWCISILLQLAEIDAALGQPERVNGRIERAIGHAERVGDLVAARYCRQALTPQ